MIFAGAAFASGNGVLKVNTKTGRGLIFAGSDDSGAVISLSNKTGEDVVQLHADEYGNGVVYAGNRKNKDRTLRPGP